MVHGYTLIHTDRTSFCRYCMSRRFAAVLDLPVVASLLRTANGKLRRKLGFDRAPQYALQ